MITASPTGLTATEQRLYDVLSDGMEHGKKELFTCINDDLASIELLRLHLHKLRKKIAPLGIALINIYGGSYRLLGSPERK